MLVEELRGSHFHRGLLAKRFQEVALWDRDVEDQRRIGVAVGQRSRNGTFVVADAGVDAVRRDPATWPMPYRLGLVSGFLLDGDGYLWMTPETVGVVAELVVATQLEDWEDLVDRVANAPWSSRMTGRSGSWRDLAAAMTEHEPDSPWLDGWQAIRDSIEAVGTALETPDSASVEGRLTR